MTSQRQRGAVTRGTKVVLALVVLGLLAGAVSVGYWQGVIHRTFPDPSKTGTDGGQQAGSATWDRKQASEELADLQEKFASAAEAGNTLGILEDARRFVERYPRYAPARNTLAQVLIYDEKQQEAYEELKRSIELDKQQPEAHLLAGTVARGLGLMEESAKHYADAASLDPRNVSYKLHLAQIYVERNDLAQAQIIVLEALAIDSSAYTAYALLSEINARRNDVPQALLNIDRAIEKTPIAVRPLQAQYILRKAALLRRSNDPDAALQVIASLTTAESREDAALNEAAVCWGMLGKPAMAAKVYEDAFANAPLNDRLAASAARWHIKAGDTRAAKAMIERIRAINPRLPVIAELEAELAK